MLAPLLITPRPWLATGRIELREFAPTDFDALYRLDSDPRVMRYIADGDTHNRAEVRDTLVRILDYYPNHFGLGVWHAGLVDSGAFIGWFCLKYCSSTCDVEVGYRLLPDHWGQGLATEGARALVRYGFEHLGLFRVIGITHPFNVASQRVLAKCGLDDRGAARYYDRPVRLFVSERKPDLKLVQ
jgi:RimJ/RimL family protein N-acetyltransferase